MKYDYTIFIGRFQPAHNAHIEIIREALKQSQNVIIMIGSSYQPRTSKNPFTAEERESMISSAFGDDEVHRLFFRYVSDKLYNDQQWAIDIQAHVQDVIEENGPTEARVAIIGHKKDNSTFYLDMFPQWKLLEFPNIQDLHATSIRDYYFWINQEDEEDIDVFEEMCIDHLDQNIYRFMDEWRSTEAFEYCRGEHEFYADYKKGWEHLPYAPIFVTVDGVVVQSGHILLVRRRSYPGKGLWALPGGFLDENETIKEGVIRELREETRLKVPVPVLKGLIKDKKTFDHPKRSLRGRTVTHAHLIELNPGPLPKVRGNDDADKAKWFTLEEVLTMEGQLFEDHYSIINYFVGRV